MWSLPGDIPDSSGKLYNSINFIVKETPDGPSVQLDALEYIQFLELDQMENKTLLNK